MSGGFVCVGVLVFVDEWRGGFLLCYGFCWCCSGVVVLLCRGLFGCGGGLVGFWGVCAVWVGVVVFFGGFEFLVGKVSVWELVCYMRGGCV